MGICPICGTMGWLKVEQVPPPDLEPVLVTFKMKDGEMRTTQPAIFLKGKVVWVPPFFADNSDYNEIIAWSKLPDPYFETE